MRIILQAFNGLLQSETIYITEVSDEIYQISFQLRSGGGMWHAEFREVKVTKFGEHVYELVDLIKPLDL